jgi:hypothetical protein
VRRRESETETLMPKNVEQRIASLELKVNALLAGVSISVVGIVALSFWFGTLKTTVSNASIKTDKIYEVVLENKDSLNTRTGILENKLDGLDRKVGDVLIPLIPRNRPVVKAFVQAHSNRTNSNLRTIPPTKSKK